MGNGTLKNLSKLDEVFKAGQGDRKQFNALSAFVRDECKRRLQAYDAQPRDATEHFEIENDILSGGYAYRQLFELVQNAADAILESGQGRGRIYVRLSPDRLVAANTGASLDQDGVVALLNARSSSKRGNQIGRFGIGFKSLLKLGGSVDIVSRSIGLRFDPSKCREIIRTHLGIGGHAAAPGMRLAEVLDPDLPASPIAERSNYAWATTVVTAGIANASVFDRLAEEMAGFPAEFLLFLPANIQLELVTEGGATRSLSKHVTGDVAVVSDGKTDSRWRLFETKVRIKNSEALSDATHIQARDEIPLSWAVPLGGRDVAGRFWAFFPTETHTLTSGILNAPWKLNSDRTNLIRGPWNNEIMKEAARLIAESLPSLASKDDYGAALGAFPRQVDRQDELAAPLAKAVWDHLVCAEVLPNANGSLCKPADLQNHCKTDEELCQEWVSLAQPDVRAKYLHPDCYKHGARISRLQAMQREALRRNVQVLDDASETDWLECVASPSIDHAKKVIRLAGKVLEGYYSQRPDPCIIVAHDDSLLKPSEAVIPGASGVPAGFFAVADELIADKRCREILVTILDVEDLSSSSWPDMLRSSLQKASEEDRSEGWEHFWSNIILAPADDSRRFLIKVCREQVKYKTSSGHWREHGLVAIPVDQDPVPADYAIDPDFLASVSHLLPDGLWDEFPLGDEKYLTNGELLNLYYGCVSPMFDRICENRVGSVPQYPPRIQGSSCLFPKGWQMLPNLPHASAARLTSHILQRIMSGHSAVKSVIIEHPTRPQAYPKVTAPNPIWLWLAFYGFIQIGNRAINIFLVNERTAEALAQAEVPGFRALCYMFRVREEGYEVNGFFPQHSTPAHSKRLWEDIFSALKDRTKGFGALSAVWELACSEGSIPSLVPTSDGPIPINRVHVTSTPLSENDPDDGHVIVLPTEVARAWIAAGAKSLTVGPTYTYKSMCSPPAKLLDVFPEMTVEPELMDALSEIETIWVTELRTQHGPREFPAEVAMNSDNLILLDQAYFNNNGRAAGIKCLLRVLASNQIVDAGDKLDQILDNIVNRRVEQARRLVRAQPTLAKRLLQAVGGTTEPLLSILEPSICRAIDEGASGETVADLALAVYGPSILGRLKSTFKDQGLMPPDRWGGEPAREFVVDIGFPVEYASSIRSQRDAEVYVSGPMRLPPLHDYQQNIIEDIRRLIGEGQGRRRAVVSLPTGGGKTRVVAEAVVQLVLRGDGRKSVLWVAQTDELCEQAVQCFRQLWVNIGEEGEDLRIIRMWGGQRNPIPPDGQDAVVTVASIQTLSNRLGYDEIAWIARSGIIVIDECHHAIASSYTALMKWLDLQVGSEKARNEEPPLLGLSATPWRGYNEDESRRLANRFDNRWFPADQASLHDKLSNMRVLAQRHYKALPYNRSVKLSIKEQNHMKQFGELPESVLERISDDDERNELIVRTVLDSSAKSILLFANSVAHAQYLAARLHLQGCSAVAVCGETDKLARQHFTRRFRENELRVICNCRVLTTGFDAPKADMVLIAQPVFSPVLYMQMVGRGLRGEKNGGTLHCEIATVEDNIENYSDRLAYHFCRRYFDEQSNISRHN